MSLQVMWSRESFWAFGASETNLVINISSSKPATVINIRPQPIDSETNDNCQAGCQESRKSSTNACEFYF